MLTAGWDHASHFSMYLEQRATGTAPFMPPAADPSGAYFEHYPQWFHSLLRCWLRWRTARWPRRCLRN